jgi:hypothetical protein
MRRTKGGAEKRENENIDKKETGTADPFEQPTV